MHQKDTYFVLRQYINLMILRAFLFYFYTMLLICAILRRTIFLYLCCALARDFFLCWLLMSSLTTPMLFIVERKFAEYRVRIHVSLIKHTVCISFSIIICDDGRFGIFFNCYAFLCTMLLMSLPLYVIKISQNKLTCLIQLFLTCL